jgi:hypothetical protein
MNLLQGVAKTRKMLAFKLIKFDMLSDNVVHLMIVAYIYSLMKR